MSTEAEGNADEEQPQEPEPSIDASGAQNVQFGDNVSHITGDGNNPITGNNNSQTNYAYYASTQPGWAGLPPAARALGEVKYPYRGLNSFREQDAPFFFGRDSTVTALLKHLSRAADGPGMLVVSGASGAGKSSLLQAGLLPRLRGEGLESHPGAAFWPSLFLTPGQSPLAELAARTALLLETADVNTIHRDLRDDPSSFARILRQAALKQPTPVGEASGVRVLLTVDQFEQVFTQCKDDGERRALIAALDAAAHGPGGTPAALVVLGVRADFETRCADYAELNGPVQNRYLVTSMTDPELREAITGPARKAEARVDPALTDALLEEVRRRPEGASTGVLPLLSHALDQTWRSQAEPGLLALEDYNRTGGIEGAVAASAEQVYHGLTPAQQAAARQVFVQLVTTDAAGNDTSARVVRADLTRGKDPAEAADIEKVLNAFADERLLTLTTNGVEVSHEALLTAWPLLHDTWLAQTRADRIVLGRLRDDAAEWQKHKPNRSYLYGGTRLQAAAETVDRADAAPSRYSLPSQLERDFLRASEHDQRRSTRRLRAAASVFATVALIAGGLAIWAYQQQNTANQEKSLTVSDQLAVQSEALDTSDPVTAALLAGAAGKISPNSPTAIESLLKVYTQPDHATMVTDSAVSDVAYGPNGKILAAGQRNGTVQLWNAAALTKIGKPITVPGSAKYGVYGVAFSRNGTLATAGSDGTVRLWNISTRTEIRQPIPVDKGGEVGGVAFSPDGHTLATSGDDGTLRFWNVSTGTEKGQPITIPGTNSFSAPGVAFSPDGQTVATALNTGKVLFWNVSTDTAAADSPITAPPNRGFTGVAFSPNGALATAESDGTIRVWNVPAHTEIGQPITTPNLSDGGGGLGGVAFSPDGNTLATAGSDSKMRLWDMTAQSQAGQQIVIPGSAIGGVNGVGFSRNGTLATAGRDDRTRFWNVSNRTEIGQPVKVPDADGDSFLSNATLSPDGQTLATITNMGNVQLWNVSTRSRIGSPITVPSNNGSVDPDIAFIPAGIAFSPDGKTLATTANDGTVRLWNVSTHAQIGSPITVAEYDSHIVSGVAFSPDGRTLATAGGDGTARLWDVSTHAQIGSPIIVPGGGEGVGGVAFSPDGRTLATAGSDGTARLWDVSTHAQIGSPIAVPGDSSHVVYGVAFSPDGRTLATAGSDGNVRLWNVAFPKNLVTAACRIAGSYLTRQQWNTYIGTSEPYQLVCPGYPPHVVQSLGQAVG